MQALGAIFESNSPEPSADLHPDLVDRAELLAFRRDASLVVAARVSIHPVRRIVDASVSVLACGHQHSVHTSVRLGEGAKHLTAGPIRFQVSDLGADAVCSFDACGLSGSLEFRPRSEALSDEARGLVTAFQLGDATASLHLDGSDTSEGELLAVRRLSRGVDPPTRNTYGAPDLELPQFLRYQCALDCGGLTVACAEEDHTGTRRREFTASATETLRAETLTHRLSPTFVPRTRWVEGAVLEIDSGPDRPTSQLTLDSMCVFPMRGLGWAHPDWAEACWHDELAVGRESILVHHLDPCGVPNLRAIHVLGAGQGEAVGLLDIVAVGPHVPSGLNGFADGADDQPRALTATVRRGSELGI